MPEFYEVSKLESRMVRDGYARLLGLYLVRLQNGESVDKEIALCKANLLKWSETYNTFS